MGARKSTQRPAPPIVTRASAKVASQMDVGDLIELKRTARSGNILGTRRILAGIVLQQASARARGRLNRDVFLDEDVRRRSALSRLPDELIEELACYRVVDEAGALFAEMTSGIADPHIRGFDYYVVYLQDVMADFIVGARLVKKGTDSETEMVMMGDHYVISGRVGRLASAMVAWMIMDELPRKLSKYISAACNASHMALTSRQVNDDIYIVEESVTQLLV